MEDYNLKIKEARLSRALQVIDAKYKSMRPEDRITAYRGFELDAFDKETLIKIISLVNESACKKPVRVDYNFEKFNSDFSKNIEDFKLLDWVIDAIYEKKLSECKWWQFAKKRKARQWRDEQHANRLKKLKEKYPVNLKSTEEYLSSQGIQWEEQYPNAGKVRRWPR